MCLRPYAVGIALPHGVSTATVPIALAYNLAHFISLLAIQGQLIITLVSDRFGFGRDVFGAVEYTANFNIGAILGLARPRAKRERERRKTLEPALTGVSRRPYNATVSSAWTVQWMC